MATASEDNFITRDDEYWQALGIEYIPTGYLDGNALGFSQINATMRVREITKEYRGYRSHKEALNGSYPGSTVVQKQTAGTAGITAFERRASRPRVNDAGFWRVVVTEKYQALYINGSINKGCEEKCFTDENPSPSYIA